MPQALGCRHACAGGVEGQAGDRHEALHGHRLRGRRQPGKSPSRGAAALHGSSGLPLPDLRGVVFCGSNSGQPYAWHCFTTCRSAQSGEGAWTVAQLRVICTLAVVLHALHAMMKAGCVELLGTVWYFRDGIW